MLIGNLSETLIMKDTTSNRHILVFMNCMVKIIMMSLIYMGLLDLLEFLTRSQAKDGVFEIILSCFQQ